jgi:hypothetical protein
VLLTQQDRFAENKLGTQRILLLFPFHSYKLLDYIWPKKKNILVPKSPGDVSWINLEKFARVSKNLRQFSLSEWQFIGSKTNQQNVFF